MKRILFEMIAMASAILVGTSLVDAAEGDFGGQSGSSGMGSFQTSRSIPETPITSGLLLREGTRVGPVSGRFVMSGQRWRFLPETPSLPDDAAANALLEQGKARKPKTDEQSLLGRSRSDTAAAETAIRGPSTRQSTSFGIGIPREKPAGQGVVHLPISLVVENLMLDRISRAIEGDPNDDRWTITGHVTEFRDENRLMIDTAVRAPIATPAR